jgi:mono/diheme cytochrome c family protein
MQYPFWDAAVSQGILIAGIAVLHVFISHFAIGGGLFLIVNEHAARRRHDAARIDFLQRLSRFFVLVTLAGGALTGVGIWFFIALLNPAATDALIHNFIWAWAIEWTFFFVEILAAILYFYGWKRQTPGAHMIIGWIYFIFAWLSLFVINGILTFMLTPGRWLASGNLRDGFFNPTFWPSLVLRSCVAITLAGLYSLLIASRYPAGKLKLNLVRNAAVWGLGGILGAIPAFFWYWGNIPPEISSPLSILPTPGLALQCALWLTVALGGLLLLFGILVPRLQHLSIALLTLLAGLGWFGSFEWFRESIRKPYIIAGFMYANGLPVAMEARIRQNGIAPLLSFRSADIGADLFRHACGHCHSFRGYKSLNPAFAGMDPAFIAAIIQSVHYLKGNMPPFWGTAAESGQMAVYIGSRTDRRSLHAIYGMEGVRLGKKVYEIRCGKCHFSGGRRDNIKAITGLSKEDYENILNNAPDLGLGMPAFTANQAERTALIEYLASRKAETK